MVRKLQKLCYSATVGELNTQRHTELAFLNSGTIITYLLSLGWKSNQRLKLIGGSWAVRPSLGGCGDLSEALQTGGNTNRGSRARLSHGGTGDLPGGAGGVTEQADSRCHTHSGASSGGHLHAGGQRGLGDQEREEPRHDVEGTFLLGQLGAFNLTATGEAAYGPRMWSHATRPLRGRSLQPGSTSARLHLRLGSMPLMEGSRGCTRVAGALAPASLRRAWPSAALP